jgi:hypothetical protein
MTKVCNYVYMRMFDKRFTSFWSISDSVLLDRKLCFVLFLVSLVVQQVVINDLVVSVAFSYSTWAKIQK